MRPGGSPGDRVHGSRTAGRALARQAGHLRRHPWRTGCVRIAVAAVAGLAAVVLGLPARAAPAARPVDLCAGGGASGWQRVDGLPTGFDVTALGGAAATGRVYAGTLDPRTSNRMYSLGIDGSAWAPVADFIGIGVVDVLSNRTGTGVGMWASGTDGATVNGVFGATDAAPLAFTPRGSLRSVQRLVTAGGEVLAASGDPAARGIYAWDPARAGWVVRGGNAIGTRAFWAFEAAPGRLWLGTDGAGAWTSADGGASWQAVEGGLSIQTATVTAIAVDPRNPDHVVIGLGPRVDAPATAPPYRGLRATADGGATWSAPVMTDVDYIAALTFGQAVPGRLIAAAYGVGLLLSDDGGTRWQTLPGPTPWSLHYNYFYDLQTLVPPGRTGCELLFVAGRGGVWARDIGRAGPLTERRFLPAAWTLSASPPSAGASDAAASVVPTPTPAAIHRALPR